MCCFQIFTAMEAQESRPLPSLQRFNSGVCAPFYTNSNRKSRHLGRISIENDYSTIIIINIREKALPVLFGSEKCRPIFAGIIQHQAHPEKCPINYYAPETSLICDELPLIFGELLLCVLRIV